MFKWILLTLLCFNLFALEISMDSARDNFSKYSILNLRDNSSFVCQELRDDFLVTTEIICAFSKKPSQRIKELQNDFFKVSSFIKKGTFFISIKPFAKIKLIPEIFNLHKENSVYDADISISKYWIVIGYKDKLPLINKRVQLKDSINFPFYMENDKLPYVGSLDIKGNPVYIKKVGDVKEYLRVKKYYKEKKYTKSRDVADEIFSEYPNTLFKAELLYYKIKIYSKLKDNDNVISNAKIYLREYSSDENIPEVLAFTAKAYSEIGMNIDADYFFDRLFSEHKNSVASQWGYVYKGEMLEASGGASVAIGFYKKALYSTTDIDVAAKAAYNLANIQLAISRKESIKYIDMIISAQPSYFMQEYSKSKAMMHIFEEYENYVTASKISTALLSSMDVNNDYYETLLKENGLWLAKTDDKKEALISLNRYIKEFPDGDYIYEVQTAKDSMFFETSDLNNSMKLAEYNKLISEYEYDSIGNKALYEKTKLLITQKKFNDVLELKDKILELDKDLYPDIEELIKEAAIGSMEHSLDTKECKNVLVISNEYNITLSEKWDDGIYECAMKGGDYQLSRVTATRNLKSDDLQERKKWLYRYIKIDFATGNYSDVIDASKELVLLIKDDVDSNYKEVYRYLFDTYDRLEKKEEMIDAMANIEDSFGLDYIDIERYISLMTIGNQRKDNNMVIRYGDKVMSIQKSSSSNAQSPYVEFTLYQAYMNIENYKKALGVIKILDSVELQKKDRSRQKYLLGSVYTKLWRDDEAKAAYVESIKADSTSAWAKLAQSASEI